jgi:hypothetical protein
MQGAGAAAQRTPDLAPFLHLLDGLPRRRAISCSGGTLNHPKERAHPGDVPDYRVTVNRRRLGSSHADTR